ncbi:hypothetical protein F994_02044 [Acinetobacter bohemicus ANC 3994]|uniref:DUF4105 domain-containing protein n=1 Tax=Acinetobacter bohemicus ANC 3994 TaxID=1217715 RepID=N8Q7K1_9GAMM|nr:hypothetical protein [Acinetobacter bohemicus]ENU19188.1 hypothetical protein F994_02044 [Acinetobacter bohemicus ANC 3994]
MASYKALLSGFILSICSLHIWAQELSEPFDNNFIMKDGYFMKKDVCTSDTLLDFKSFSIAQFLKHFNKNQTDLITTDSGDDALFIKPFDISYNNLLTYTNPQPNDFNRYRLIVMALYTPVLEDTCLLGFGIFPEGWDGKNWIRFKSNKKLESKFLEDYLNSENLK